MKQRNQQQQQKEANADRSMNEDASMDAETTREAGWKDTDRSSSDEDMPV